MKIIEGLEQRTKAWFEFRSQGIGASEASVLVNANPWKTVDSLWLDKLGEGREMQDNAHMQRGRDLEPVALDKYEKSFGVKMTPLCAIHDTLSWARASFDGINLEVKKVMEIKCPGETDHNMAAKGRVPKKYIPQLQWQMLVSGFECNDYTSYYDGDLQVVPCFRDDKMIKTLLEKGEWFWNMVLSKRPPTDGVDEKTSLAFAEYAALDAQIKLLEAEKEDVKGYIKSIVSDSTVAAGYKAQWIERKGSVDYNKIEVLKTIDLEKYRKTPIKVFDLRPVGSKE